jgi:hypothetical protein
VAILVAGVLGLRLLHLPTLFAALEAVMLYALLAAGFNLTSP